MTALKKGLAAPQYRQQQFRLLSTTQDFLHGTTPRQQQPNRFTKIYSAMQQTCPNAIRLYATCVTAANESEEQLKQGSCAAEFEAVKDCFRTIRRQQQQKRA